MTIFVTWQLRVTLDSIRNICDVQIFLKKSFDYCSASNAMERFLVVAQRPQKVVGQNKGFSPPFDIFSPLVKATFQQFGTFLLMLMLLTRNSISFHFVLPPSPGTVPLNHQALSSPRWQFMDGTSPENIGRNPFVLGEGNMGMEIRIEYGWRNWDRWGFMGWHWGDKIIGIFLLKSMSLLRQAPAKKALIHTNHHIYSHKPTETNLSSFYNASIIDVRTNHRECWWKCDFTHFLSLLMANEEYKEGCELWNNEDVSLFFFS